VVSVTVEYALEFPLLSPPPPPPPPRFCRYAATRRSSW